MRAPKSPIPICSLMVRVLNKGRFFSMARISFSTAPTSVVGATAVLTWSDMPVS